MILHDTIELIKGKYGHLFEAATIEKASFGLHFTAVKLSTGYSGMSKTETLNFFKYTYNRKKNFGPFCPGKIQGQKVSDLFNFKSDSLLIDILKLAVLNALSSQIIEEGTYNVIENIDPIDLVDISADKTICLVGAFQSYIDKICKQGNNLLIVELDEDALDDVHKKHFVPADTSAEAFSKSDIIIITGSALANNTIDELLNKIAPEKQVIVVGPTGSIVPDVLFNHHVDIIGAIRILDADRMFRIVEEGGAGYHLFENICAKKICILNAKK